MWGQRFSQVNSLSHKYISVTIIRTCTSVYIEKHMEKIDAEIQGNGLTLKNPESW